MADYTSKSGPDKRPMTKLEQLVDHVDTIRRNRKPLENQWKVNKAFYAGNQYAYVNPKTSRVERLGTAPGEKPRWRVRLTSNQITRNTHARVATLTKSKPVFYATPSDTDIDSVHAASVAESLMTHWWHHLKLKKKLNDVLISSAISGGYWWITYDPSAGEAVEYTVDPNTMQPIIEYGLRQLFEQELEQMGIDPRMVRQTIYPGDLRVDVLGGEQVLIDPSAKNWEDAKFVIVAHGMSVDDIKAKWKKAPKDLDPNVAPAGAESVPLAYSRPTATPARDKTLREVFFEYYQPCPALPRGRYTIFLKEPDIELEGGDWPFPFSDLPIIKFPGIPVPDSPYDATVIEQAVPLQRELNRTLSQIMEYKNLTVAPQWTVPVGSLRTPITNEPGLVIEYNVQGNGLVPEQKMPGALPPYLIELARDIKAQIKEQFGLTEIQQGTPPPNVEAGIAIDLLQEMATDQLAPVIELIEQRVEEAGNMMLQLAAQHYDESRIINLIGTNSRVKVQSFLKSKTNLANGAVIRVEAGSGMPRTRAGRQAKVLEMVDKGFMAPHQGMRFMDLADFTGLRAKLEQDENQALREHEKMFKREPLNQMALQQAAAELEMMAASGQIDQDQAQQILMEAAFSPNDWDHDEAHIDVHSSFLKSVEFERLPPDVQQPFVIHYELHLRRIAENAPQPEGEAPRVSVQVRGAVGATAMESILAKSGVQLEPGIIAAEPPLETVVFDSLDKENPSPEDEALDTAQKMADIELTDAKTREALARAKAAANPKPAPARN